MGLSDLASTLTTPVMDGSSRLATFLLRPFTQSHFLSQPILSLADRLGPAKPYVAVFGACTIGYHVTRASWSFWRGAISYLLAGPLRLGTNLGTLTADGGWAGEFCVSLVYFPAVNRKI